jgi:hypothetical protein
MGVSPMASSSHVGRDDAWLQDLLDQTWDNHFSDVPQDNDVRIEFGRRAKRRLGSIRLDQNDRKTSVITMNGIFKLSEVPEFVVQATLVHELTHYAHGFNSPLAQKQSHPHAGGVMRREFEERGLLELYLKQKRWLKAYWGELLIQEFGTPVRRIKQVQSVRALRVPKPFWFH